MPALDFTEVPEAHKATGLQDTFEFLARDFFKTLGFDIESGPDRGQDGGRDLIVIECRKGALGLTQRKWLVSCKHKAHSGLAVKADDEQDINDRVRSHDADGFIGFYSTLVSAPLARKLDGLKNELDIKVFDREDIETVLLSEAEARKVTKRYFPLSYSNWEDAQQQPSNFLDVYEPLECVVCGRDLLSGKSRSGYGGLVAWVRRNDGQHEVRRYVDFYWACKGECDKEVASSYPNGFSTSWEDISDILIPTNYVKWHVGIMNTIYKGKSKYNCTSFEKVKEFTIKIAQLTVRKQTETQIERLRALAKLPEGI